MEKVLQRENKQTGTKEWQRGRNHMEDTAGCRLSCGSPSLLEEEANSHVLGMNLIMAGKHRQSWREHSRKKQIGQTGIAIRQKHEIQTGTEARRLEAVSQRLED